MICSTCYETTLKACPATIDLIAGLSPNTTYYWLLTTPRRTLFQRQETTDANGKLTIDCNASFPAGLLNQHAGFFELEVREGDNYLNTVPLTIGNKTYDCVMIQFANIDAEPANLYNVIK